MEKKDIEIPFGAFDSELGGFEYTIPEGYKAEIKDGKVVVRKTESDDERIRKELKKVLDECLNARPQIVEEKQYIRLITWLENQGEQNLAEWPEDWSEEDENRFKNLIELVEQSNEGKGTKDGFVKFRNRLKSLKLQNTLKPSAWSEEDEEIIKRIDFWLYSRLYSQCKGREYKEIHNWLKSLKDRVQPQPKWSKEDENNILFLTSIIEECFKDKEKITLCGDTACANFTKKKCY